MVLKDRLRCLLVSSCVLKLSKNQMQPTLARKHCPAVKYLIYPLAGPCRIAYLAGLKRSPLMFAVVNLRDVCYSCLAIFD